MKSAEEWRNEILRALITGAKAKGHGVNETRPDFIRAIQADALESGRREEAMAIWDSAKPKADDLPFGSSFDRSIETIRAKARETALRDAAACKMTCEGHEGGQYCEKFCVQGCEKILSLIPGQLPPAFSDGHEH
jgi:hypothetical protein